MLQYLLGKNAIIVDEPSTKNDVVPKILSIWLENAFGKNKDVNIVRMQKYEKNIPIEKNSKSIDNQTNVNDKYVMKYEKDIEDIAKMCFIVAKDFVSHIKFFMHHNHTFSNSLIL
jgi:hypothetical protein